MEDSEVHLLDYLRVVYKRKWIIVAVMMIVMALGAFRVYRAVPIYEAVCTISIGDRQSTTIHGGQVVQYTDYWSSEKNVNTHRHIILSEPVLEDVIKTLNLDTPSSAPARPEGLKGYYRIESVKDTNLIRIKATHTDPETAQKLSNTLAMTYRDFNINKRLQSSENSVLWLKREISDLKKKMEEADYRLYQYKQKSHILSLEKETKMQAEELSELRSTHNQTHVKRIEVEAKIKELDRILSLKNKYIPAFLEGDVLATLNNNLVAAKLELAQLQKKYGPRHPKIIATQSNVASILAQINHNIRKAIKSLRSENSVLLAKEKTLAATIDNYTNKAMDTEQKQVQYALLEKETQLNKELYDILVAKLKEINITEGLETPEITIVEAAELPRAPTSSKRNMNLAMAAIIGLVLALGLTFFLEYLDVGLSTREETEKFLELPVLGVIPHTQTRN